jgi:mono/diheme cytochrome c family protein
MTRESMARWLALATATLVVLLSAAFAALRNLAPLRSPAPSAPRIAAPAGPADAARIAAGRAAFERLNCAMCHAIEGRGNPSHPLDGVGSRLDRDALRDWTLGTGAASGKLGGVAQTKQRNAKDPDLDALLDYLAQLR